MTYLEIVNHKNFHKANDLIYKAEQKLLEMGLSRDEARGWLTTWASGAGDGSN